MLRVKLAPLKRHAGTAVCGSGLATPSTGRTISTKEPWHPLHGRLGWSQKICCSRRGKQTRTTYSNIPTNEKVHVPHFCTAVQNYGPAYNTEPATLFMWPTRTEDTTLIHTLIRVRFSKTQSAYKNGQKIKDTKCPALCKTQPTTAEFSFNS